MNSQYEDLLAFQLAQSNIKFERQYKFCPNRKWRADFYIRPMILAEVQGLVNLNVGLSRHTTIKGYTLDCERNNEAQLLGYMLLQFTQQQVKNGLALETIKRAIEIKMMNLID